MAETNATGACVTLLWPKAVECRADVKPREVLLRFNRPIESSQLESLARKLSPWIRSAEQGYDTLLLVSAQDTLFRVTVVGTVVRVNIRLAAPALPAGPPAEKPEPESESPDPDTRMRSIQVLSDAGRTREAAGLLDELRVKHPDEAQVPAELAELEARRGHWRRADDLFREALRLQPDDEDLQEQRRAFRADRATRADVDASLETDGGDRNEARVRVGGQWLSPPEGSAAGLSAGAWVEDVHLDANRLQRSDGRVADFAGDRQRAAFFARYDTMAGTWVQVGEYAAASGPGARLEAGQPDDYGETGLAGDYHRPYWELAEGIAGDATRDRVEVRRQFRQGSRWNAGLTGAWNRYGVEDWDDAATSVSLECNIAVQVAASPVEVSFEYALDAEHLQSVAEGILPPEPDPANADPVSAASGQATGTAAAGDSADVYHPLGIEDREVHSLRAIVSFPLPASWSFEVSSGGEWDRECGGSSPCFGGHLTYRQRQWIGHLGIERSRDFVDNRQQVSYASAALACLF